MELLKVSQPIVNHYVNLVKAGRKDIMDVPENLREEVAELAGIDLHKKTLEEEKEIKIAELSEICKETIVNGTDIELSEGDLHFKFSTNEQNDIKNLYDVSLITKEPMPYHSDGEECKLFSCSDISKLYVGMQKWIIHNTTYFNALKAMVNDMTSIDEVKAVAYGDELTGDHKTNYDTMIDQSYDALDKLIVK